MNYYRLWNTIRHLKGKQILFQMFYRLYKPKFKSYSLTFATCESAQEYRLLADPIPRWMCCEGNSFTFLNMEHKFSGWNFTGNGILWTYNQNYFDWINQVDSPKEEACLWIDKFIVDMPKNKVGLDAYPIALRCINWVKFFCRYPEAATKPRLDSLWSQYKLLERKIEYHLMGNHLLEDAFSLTIGGHYFCDERMKQKAMKLMLQELQEQILPDGAHYEQSPMYHCILLDRLLDVYNYTGIAELVPFAQRMLGHLESICYEDGSWPFLGDAALGIAPTPQAIKDYARKLGLTWNTLPLMECGYRKMRSERMEAFVDLGNIMATYQPGHSHADALTFELRIDGKPFIVDTGISTYEKNAQRQYERSTAAHNTVTSKGRNSSEVWGGFRVGKRCNARCTKDDKHCIEAEHDGFGLVHRRKFAINDYQFVISDFCKAEDCVAHLHFAPEIKDFFIEGYSIHTSFADIKVTGKSLSITLVNCEVSTEYNIKKKSKELLISFNEECHITIETLSNIQKT